MKAIRLTVLSVSALGLAFSTSCSTTRGFGQDLQKVGNRIEERADATGGAVSPPSTGLSTPMTAPGAAAPYGY